ncbi:MAG: hypothetical protein WBG32_12305 [Nodosilinea sp.]
MKGTFLALGIMLAPMPTPVSAQLLAETACPDTYLNGWCYAFRNNVHSIHTQTPDNHLLMFSAIQESGEHYEMVMITNIATGEVVFEAAYDVGRGGGKILNGTVGVGQRYLSQIQAAEDFMRTVLN